MSQITIEKRDRKLICIDYDGTYTEAPEVFDIFIKALKNRGYRVIICTMRYAEETDEDLIYLLTLVDKIYFSGRKAKKPYLASLGIYPQIWIDDMPEFILGDALS